MKKFVLFALLLLLTGCSKTVQIACNEPEIEVFIDDENYGRPPILLKVPHNKLYVYVKAKVLESNANNATIFAQREIFGVDVFSVVNQFTKKVLISENVVK